MASARLYPVGFSVAALLGVAVVVLFAWLIPDRMEEAVRERLETESRQLSEHVRRIVHAELKEAESATLLGARLPGAPDRDAAFWSRVEKSLESRLEGLPHLRGLEFYLEKSGGLEGQYRVLECPPWAPAPGTESTARLVEDGRAMVAFSVDHSGQRYWINAWLDFESWVAERRRISGIAVFLVVVLGVVIYVLATLAILMSRAQASTLQRERLRSLRLEAIGDLAGGIAHEVRNPLNAISLGVQFVERKFAKTGEPPEPRDYARLHGEVSKIRNVVDDFVRFARIRNLESKPYDMGEVVREVLEGLSERRHSLGIDLRLTIAERSGLNLLGDRERVAEVLTSVIGAGISAMGSTRDRPLSVEVASTTREVHVVVTDPGPVPEGSAQERLLDPYFARSRDRIGLGMTVARTLVESHGGRIEAVPADGGGVVVRVILPRRFSA